MPPLVLAPATSSVPVVKQAVLYKLKLHLQTSRAFADQLLQIGISEADVEAAMELAADRLGKGDAACDVTLEVSRAFGGQGFALERATVFASTGQTVIERRRGALAVASRSPIRKTVPLV